EDPIDETELLRVRGGHRGASPVVVADRLEGDASPRSDAAKKLFRQLVEVFHDYGLALVGAEVRAFVGAVGVRQLDEGIDDPEAHGRADGPERRAPADRFDVPRRGGETVGGALGVLCPDSDPLARVRAEVRDLVERIEETVDG